MNDQAKQDVNNEVVEEAVLEAVVEQKADEKISEKRKIKPCDIKYLNTQYSGQITSTLPPSYASWTASGFSI